LTRVIVLFLPLLALSGCFLLSSGPSPRVEDCAQIRQATPTEYFCDGKLYTSVQLTELRHGVAE
jgi:hypothetical protein